MPTIHDSIRAIGKCVPMLLHPMGKRRAAREWRKRKAAIRKHDRGLCACKEGSKWNR